MQVFIVPARNDLPFYQFTITLSGVLFQLEFKYNTRMSRWILSINDPSGNQIMSGIPILIGRALFNQYVELPIPEGTFFAQDNTLQEQQPTQFSFGLQNTLYYVDPTQ